MIAPRTLQSFFPAAFLMALPLTAYPTGVGISDQEMHRAIIAFERCVKDDRTPVTRPFTAVCGVPVYSRAMLQQNLPYIGRSNYSPISTETDGALQNRKYYYFKRDRDSQVVVVLERRAGRVVIAGIGVSAR
jgi:hypothetical protein